MNRTNITKLVIIALCCGYLSCIIINWLTKPKQVGEIEAPFNEVAVCPEMAYVEFWENCLLHLNERYPWKLTASWDSQLMPELIGQTSHDRFKELAEKYRLDASLFWQIENKYNT